MDHYSSDPYGRFRTHRSERYRHPERDQQRYRFDDYGDAAHGGYGNESYGGTFGNQGNEMGGSRHVANKGTNAYAASFNYGNMGSYGGAQGFGSERGGYPHRRSQARGSEFESGMGGSYSGYDRDSGQHRRYGYMSDYDSHGQNDRDSRRSSELYGDYASRRFQGVQGQRHYDFERDDYQPHSYGGNRGNYIGSGYDRTPRKNEYGATRGDYGSAGQYMGRYSRSSYDEPYGMSGYYRGGYSDSDYESYARDRDERSNDW